MTLTKWMTIAAAMVVLGAVGGGVRVAARPDGLEASKGQARVQKAEAPARPALKAVEELQSWINRYDTQLAARQSEIDRQQAEINDLKDRIRQLEARIKTYAARRADRPSVEPRKAEPEAWIKADADIVTVSSPAPKSSAAAGAADPKPAQPDDKPSPFDRIIRGPRALVAVSGTNDRVVIYTPDATGVGQSRLYRPPPGMTGLSVSFHGENVTVVANGKGVVHLANYNLKTDQWALQDIRGATDGRVDIPAEDGMLARRDLLPCIFRGSGFTQLAILDLEHATWTVQNLLEPSEESITPYVVGKLALYVVGRHLYAYSAEAGRWGTLSLDERLLPAAGIAPGQDHSPLWTQVGMFAVSQHGQLRVFNGKLGRWQSINPKD